MAQEAEVEKPPILECRGLSFWYSNKQVLENISMKIEENEITALIGPSGCGKSTLLKCFNRMNDLIKGIRITGDVLFQGESILSRNTDPVELRYRIGMIFQRPNPFPKSIFENVAFGPKVNGYKGNLKELVEQSLVRAHLWDEVKDRIKSSALSLSGGQQQRLCIARAIAVNPQVILMDEPCTALDPIATGRIEELMIELTEFYTVLIVTHNMQQASRMSKYTAFLLSEKEEDGSASPGRLIELGETKEIFTNPKDERTEAYITGRFG